MAAKAILFSFGLVAVLLLLGYWVSQKYGLYELDDKDIEGFVFKNAFMKQVHDQFIDRK
jgi:hypothetical protein